MDIAALILSIVSLIASLGCLTIMLAKNFFSTHQVQMVPVDPFKQMADGISPEIGKIIGDQFREIGDPIDSEELEYLETMRKKKTTSL